MTAAIGEPSGQGGILGSKHSVGNLDIQSDAELDTGRSFGRPRATIRLWPCRHLVSLRCQFSCTLPRQPILVRGTPQHTARLYPVPDRCLSSSFFAKGKKKVNAIDV